MIHIAICEDMPDQLALLTKLIKDYIKTYNLMADIQCFSHPDRLLTACQTENFHIYLLDMVMPMINGLDVGRSIRRTSREAQIIYITAEPGFALDAYAVNPLHYLLKPVQKSILFETLSLAVSKLEHAMEASVTFKIKNGWYTLAAGEIACGEYKRHMVTYTLLGGMQVKTTTISGSFAEHIAPLLQDERFLSPHVSYIVNLSRVEKLTREGFTLMDGVFVPVSGRNYVTVRDSYLTYRLGEGGK